MKKQLLIVSLSILLTGSCFGQVTDYNFTFEPGTTQGTWNYFENGSNTTGLTFVANPVSGGINTSATVAKFTAAADGGEWSGCESIYGTLGKWKFDGLNPTTVTVDVYKTTLSPVTLKFTSTNASGQGTVFSASKVPSAINEWVTLTYVVDFAAFGGENNADNNAGTNQVVFHGDQVTPRTEDHIVYFDNLKFTATKLADPVLPPTPVTPPTVHAPTQPSRSASDVVSIYSGPYADLAGTKIGKNWGEATDASDITVDGDLTKQLLKFNYQGIVLEAPINLVGFEKLHIDFFKTDQAQINLSIIHVGGGDITKLIDISNQGWNSFDIPLSDFVGLNLATVHQLKLAGAPIQGSTTVFFDNLYFYKGTASPAADATLSDLKVDGTTIAGFSPSTISYTVALPSGTTVVPTVTATTNDAEATSIITAATALPGTSTVVVTAKDGTTKKTYSVVFSLAPAEPAVAAPTPTVNAADVLSIFSNAYTDLAGTNFNPGWGQATVTTQVDIAGNKTLKYAGLTFQGTNLGSADGTPQDLTSKTYMHLDYWTDDATLPLKVTLVSKTGGEKAFTCDPLTKGSWVSVDIPLKHYTDLGLKISDIYQLKMEGNGAFLNGTWYIDNIYFYKESITGVKQLNSAKNNVVVYPNPAENDLYISSKSTLSKVAIYNTVGKQLKEYSNVLQSINVSDLKTGVYMIKTTDVNGKTTTTKFVKK